MAYLKSLISSLALVCLAVGLPQAEQARAATYNVVDDFSIAANPNGVWSYGEGIGATSFTPFTHTVSTAISQFWQSSAPSLGAPAVIKNTTGAPFVASTAIFLPNVLDVHPGPLTDVIVRFTAPAAGVYSYAGLFEIMDFVAPLGVIGNIYHNNSLLFSQGIAGAATASTFTPGGSAVFSGLVSLDASDTLSFVVNNGGSFTYDSTGLVLSIASVPEPSTWAMLLLGFAGVGYLGWRQRRASVQAS